MSRRYWLTRSAAIFCGRSQIYGSCPETFWHSVARRFALDSPQRYGVPGEVNRCGRLPGTGGNPMATTVHVDLGDRGYEIHIGRGIVPGEIFRDGGPSRALLVSDSNVDPLHGDRCRDALRSSAPSLSSPTSSPGSTSAQSANRTTASCR